MVPSLTITLYRISELLSHYLCVTYTSNLHSSTFEPLKHLGIKHLAHECKTLAWVAVKPTS